MFCRGHVFESGEQLIYDTVHENAEAVAEQIEKIHSEEAPPGEQEHTCIIERWPAI